MPLGPPLMARRRRGLQRNAVTAFTVLASTGAEHAQATVGCRAGLVQGSKGRRPAIGSNPIHGAKVANCAIENRLL
jgi:hypothetical protein